MDRKQIKNSMDRTIIWPTLSLTLVFLSLLTVLYIYVESYFSFTSSLLAFMISLLLIPGLQMFLDFTNMKEPILDFWKECPMIIHKGIVISYLSLITIMCQKYLIPIFKLNYEKSKE